MISLIRLHLKFLKKRMDAFALKILEEFKIIIFWISSKLDYSLCSLFVLISLPATNHQIRLIPYTLYQKPQKVLMKKHLNKFLIFYLIMIMTKKSQFMVLEPKLRCQHFTVIIKLIIVFLSMEMKMMPMYIWFKEL